MYRNILIILQYWKVKNSGSRLFVVPTPTPSKKFTHNYFNSPAHRQTDKPTAGCCHLVYLMVGSYSHCPSNSLWKFHHHSCNCFNNVATVLNIVTESTVNKPSLTVCCWQLRLVGWLVFNGTLSTTRGLSYRVPQKKSAPQCSMWT